MAKKLYVIIHTYQFDLSVYVVRSKELPSKEEVVKACSIDLEEDHGEYLEIIEAGKIFEI